MDTKRVVVITGAAGGIGVPLVERFIRNGERSSPLTRARPRSSN